MSGSINKCILVGHVGQDPEIRTTQSGSKIANLSLATSERWRDRNSGEQREKTEWHKISVFSEGLVKVIEQYVHKGSKLYIEGQIQTRKWQDQSGADRYSTEIVLNGFNASLVLLDGPSGDSQPKQQERRSTGSASAQAPNWDDGDGIPFVPEFR